MYTVDNIVSKLYTVYVTASVSITVPSIKYVLDNADRIQYVCGTYITTLQCAATEFFLDTVLSI